MDEPAFIAALQALTTDPVARGLTDDAAVDGAMVVTHDMMVEGVHWLPHADPADVAWKLVARNYSDLAAKGAMPRGVLLGYQLGSDDWDVRFVAGLGEALSAMGGALWGGDTNALPGPGARTLGMTAIGRSAHIPAPSRSSARAGDTVWLTGSIGAAYAGFLADSGGAAAPADAIARFRRPTPRLVEGAALAPLASAMMDVSDGLWLDATRLARTSRVTVSLDRSAIPFAEAVPPDQQDKAAGWGDDYELLFTLPPSRPCPARGATRRTSCGRNTSLSTNR